jgi:fatty acid-binding protein DegV
MPLVIVTDSTCDLPLQLVEVHALEVVPSILVLDGIEYADGTGISRQEFYARLPEYRSAPTTAAPSTGEFSARYERLLGRAAHVTDHAASAPRS